MKENYIKASQVAQKYALVNEQKRQRVIVTIDPNIWEDTPINPTKYLGDQTATFKENQRNWKEVFVAKVAEIKAAAKARGQPEYAGGGSLE